MRILVTGAQGYLGKSVTQELISRGETVFPTGRRPGNGIWVCDLLKYDSVSHMISEIQPHKIVHCAAFVPQTQEDYQDSKGSEASLAMLNNLLLASSCPLIYISSMTVYDTSGNGPKHESDVGNPTSAYGQGKRQGEEMLKKDGRPVFSIRIPGLFGPPRMDGLVVNIVKACREGVNLSLPDLPILWAAMLVEDASISIALLTLKNTDKFQAINVGYRGIYSISRFITEVAEIYGRSIEYHVAQPDFEYDLGKAEELSILPKRSFRQAIEDLGNML